MPRSHPIEDYRNFGIMAHIDAGKTTTTERILYYTGKSHKIGEVHDGAATMDFMEQEQERGITITSAATTAIWKDKRLNIIDTPGPRRLHHRGRAFAARARRRRRACSTATRAWSRRPRRSGARATSIKRSAHRLRQQDGQDRRRLLQVPEDIVDRLGAKPIAIQLPIGAESQFKGLIDLVRMKAVIWEDEALGAKFKDIDIPGRPARPGKEYREKMVEAAVELDDEALTAFLDGKEPDEATLKRLIRKAVLTGAFYPVLCGSAFKNKGVQPLLDAVVDYLPSPVDVPPIKGIDHKGEEVVRKADDNEPMALLAFKIMDDPFVGTITFCRIYSGMLSSGTGVVNSTRERKERVGRMLLMHANNREDIKEAYAGDIVALAGLKETRTGDTLCDPTSRSFSKRWNSPSRSSRSRSSRSRRPTRKSSASRWRSSPPKIRPSACRPIRKVGQTILKGMGELHLDIKVDILQAHLQGRSQYRRAAGCVSARSITQAGAEVDYTHKKQTGGTGQFARVKFVFEPNEPGKGFEFESKIVGGNVPKEYIPGVEKGLNSVLGSGVLAGFPVVDVKVHADRRRLSRRRLVGAGVRNRLARRVPRSAAEGRLGPARADHEGRSDDPGRLYRLRHRRSEFAARPDPGPGHARQRQRHQRDGAAANMFGYVNTLRSMSQGRATFTMQFDHYAEAPRNVSEEVQKKFA